jgi:hypothetical protein
LDQFRFNHFSSYTRQSHMYMFSTYKKSNLYTHVRISNEKPPKLPQSTDEPYKEGELSANKITPPPVISRFKTTDPLYSVVSFYRPDTRIIFYVVYRLCRLYRASAVITNRRVAGGNESGLSKYVRGGNALRIWRSPINRHRLGYTMGNAHSRAISLIITYKCYNLPALRYLTKFAST